MDRRLIGALLIVVTFTAAVVVPALKGLNRGGDGVAIVLPADPEVGDCLLNTWGGFAFTPAASTPGSPSSGPAAGTGTPGTGRPTAAQLSAPRFFGGCTGPVAGEVLAVVHATGDDRTRRSRAVQIGPDCRTLALEHAGLVQTEARTFAVPDQPAEQISWNLSINLRSAWIAPDPLLRAAGRTWVACVAAPGWGGFYRGTLAAAYAGGMLPNGFGNCWDQPTDGADTHPVSCGTPHQAELISMGTTTQGTDTTADAERSCGRLAARVMGRADPTAGGALIVKVDAPAGAPPPFARRALTCFVVPVEGELVGTVVGLGDRPVPFGS